MLRDKLLKYSFHNQVWESRSWRCVGGTSRVSLEPGHLYVGMLSHQEAVTARIITVYTLVGDHYRVSFATVTVRGFAS